MAQLCRGEGRPLDLCEAGALPPPSDPPQLVGRDAEGPLTLTLFPSLPEAHLPLRRTQDWESRMFCKPGWLD